MLGNTGELVERSLSSSKPTTVPSVRRRHSSRRLALAAVVLVCAAFIALEILFTVSAASESGCGLCHRPSQAAADLSQSPHRGTDCSSCHKLPGMSGAIRYNLQAADHFVTWLLRRPASYGGQSGAVGSSCPGCHQGLAKGVVTVGDVRMSHKQVMESVEGDSGSAVIPCTVCHAQVAHAPTLGGVASLEAHSSCVACHDGLTASEDCATCHTDSSVQQASAEARGDSHPEDWADRHGMGDQATCSLCHPSEYCQRCHKVLLPHDPSTYIYSHGKEAVSAGAEACVPCHEQTSCAGCHKVPMPHDADYLQQHGNQALERGTQVCVECHAPADCDTCHLRHIHPGVPDSVREKLAAQSSGAGPSDPAISTTSTTSGGS